MDGAGEDVVGAGALGFDVLVADHREGFDGAVGEDVGDAAGGLAVEFVAEHALHDLFVHIVEAAGALQVGVADLLVGLPVGVPEFGDGHAQIAGPGHGGFRILPVFADGFREIGLGQRFREFGFDVVVLQQHAAHHLIGGAEAHQRILEPTLVLAEIFLFFHQRLYTTPWTGSP